MGDHPSHGPCCGGMLRRKGCATTLKKRPTAVALEWSIAPQRILQSLDRYQTVQRCFTRKEPRLTPVLVMLGVTENPHPRRTTYQCRYAGVRKRLVVADCCGSLRQMFTKIAICHEKSRRDSAERHQPLRVGEPKPCRTPPNFSLITDEPSHQSCWRSLRRFRHCARFRRLIGL